MTFFVEKRGKSKSENLDKRLNVVYNKADRTESRANCNPKRKQGAIEADMAILAQSVRAPVCGAGGHGFESRKSPLVQRIDVH